MSAKNLAKNTGIAVLFLTAATGLSLGIDKALDVCSDIGQKAALEISKATKPEFQNLR